jgi:hypothetical protein
VVIWKLPKDDAANGGNAKTIEGGSKAGRTSGAVVSGEVAGRSIG